MNGLQDRASVLPDGADRIRSVETEAEQPSLTYRLDLENHRIGPLIDGEDAVRQAIGKAIMTERFKNLIYSNQYGSEIAELIGGEHVSKAYIETEVRRCVISALSVDSRVFNVRDFTFEYGDGYVQVTFLAQTIYGDMNISQMYWR